MRDTVEIGPVPAEESCQQLGSKNYDETVARQECARFRDLIRQTCGDEPAGAVLKIKMQSHEFGCYFEVVCSFETENETAASYAWFLERNSPLKWDGAGGKRFQPSIPA